MGFLGVIATTANPSELAFQLDELASCTSGADDCLEQREGGGGGVEVAATTAEGDPFMLRFLETKRVWVSIAGSIKAIRATCARSI